MRTTLKRGIGQVGGHNGNGHSAAPPLFGPIVRYRQPGPPQRPLIALILRGFGWLVLAAVVIASGAAGGFYLYGHESLGAVINKTRVVKKLSHDLAYAKPGDPAIALVAGYDVRGAPGGKNPYAGSNSDTLMLLRANPKNNTLSLLSFPRDFWVRIYCHGDTYDSMDRINAAWSHCSNGPAGTLDTMEKLTGLKINYFITLDFHAFKQLVNQLHGVYINVDRRYFIAPNTGTSAINLHPGYQKLTGGAALSYVRYRHTDSDIYRTGRQQLFIEALKSRLRTSLSLTNFLVKGPAILGVLKRNIEVGTATQQKVGLGTLKSYLGLLYDLPPGHLIRNQIPLNAFHYFVSPGGADVEDASPGAVAAAVQRFLHPSVPAAASNTGAHKKTGPKKKVRKLRKSQISTLVLNGGRVAGEAANTTYLLTTKGYSTKTLPSGEVANAPRVLSNTIVYYDPVQPNAKQAAQQLAPLFGSHTKVAQMNSVIAAFAKRAGNPLTVVAVGTSFGGKLVVPHHAKPLPQPPAQVSEGAAATAPGLRHVYDEVHFPLMVPHKIAEGSVLSDSEGVRGFKPIGHQHEVVLTFNVLGTFKYWQIEESTWNSAPILQNPSYSFVHRGQKFQVYTTGGAIQMVALRTSGATYWVVNTILNELSNKTMLAIAESFRPLRR